MVDTMYLILPGHARQALLVRGLVGCGGVIGLLIAATRLPLAVVSLLGFLAPLVTAGCAPTPSPPSRLIREQQVDAHTSTVVSLLGFLAPLVTAGCAPTPSPPSRLIREQQGDSHTSTVVSLLGFLAPLVTAGCAPTPSPPSRLIIHPRTAGGLTHLYAWPFSREGRWLGWIVPTPAGHPTCLRHAAPLTCRCDKRGTHAPPRLALPWRGEVAGLACPHTLPPFTQLP